MVKATLRCAVLLGLVAWSVPALAEVQNVKVGGDLTVRAFHRRNLDLHDGGPEAAVADTLNEDNFWMTTTGLNIGADLTDNISAVIRLANERDWNQLAAAADAEGVSDFDLSQAYVTLKELFYAPLTLRVGTQPIVWGRGFVLGSNLIPGLILGGGDRNAAITANEFTDFTSFDAIRATLDLSNVGGLNLPLTVEYVYVKLDENTIGLPDDINLQGVNVGTRFEAWNSETEVYFLNKRDKSVTGVVPAAAGGQGSVSTFGVRGSAQPVEGAYLWGELAYQFGKRAADPAGILVMGNPHEAWATNLGLEYTFADVATTPKLGGEWIFFSGKNLDGAVAGWDPIARGYFTTALREFQNATAAAFYPPDQTCLASAALGTGCTGSATNQHQLSVWTSLKPLEDLTIAPRLSWFFLDVGARPDQAAAGTQINEDRKNYAGMEWDTQVTYDYTEDVQFGILYALFKPGTTYRDPTDSTAQELVTSVSLKF